MRWLEDKEQGRASAFLGRAAHRPAAAVLLAMDGVPHILMGQEFDEPTWTGWPVLFEPYRLDWRAFDGELYAHYQALIALRRRHAALRTGNTAFLEDLPPGTIGYTRSADNERIVVLANLSAVTVQFETSRWPDPASSSAMFETGRPRMTALYASGWREEGATLAPHGWIIGAMAGTPCTKA